MIVRGRRVCGRIVLVGRASPRRVDGLETGETYFLRAARCEECICDETRGGSAAPHFRPFYWRRDVGDLL